MKRTLITIIFLVMLSAILYGETTEPQIAYRFLDDFIMNKALAAENGHRVGASITMGLGVILVSAAAGLYIWGDDLFNTATDGSEPGWTNETRDIVCLSLGAGGLVTLGTGMAILFSPKEDYKAKYSYIYNEADPVVQEALAAAALYDLADTAKKNRITSGIIDLATPLLTIIIGIVVNVVENRTWYQDISTTTYSLSWNLISGFSKIFINKSEEERLYDKYRHTKEALLVSRKNNVAFND